MFILTVLLFVSFQGVGPDRDEKSYDRKSQVYGELVTLLKNMSLHFAEDIRKQVMI